MDDANHKWRTCFGSTGLVVLVLAAASCADSLATEPEDAIKIGLLVPFTGEQASKGINYERAITMAVETINEQGGLAGRPIWIEARDTHSDVETGMESAVDLIKREKVLALIGPDNVELIQKMQPLVESARVAQILPEVVSKKAVTSTSGLWFRIAPSIELMGCSLAQEIYNQRYRQVLVVHSKRIESAAMAKGIVDTLDWYNNGDQDKAVSHLMAVDEASLSDNELYAELLLFKPDVIVLITSPSAGSRIVQDLALYSDEVSWYLGPELGTQVLFDNIPPGALEGAHVVSTEIADWEEGDKFAESFRDRWNNDVPFDLSFFYYDALAMLAISTERATPKNGSAPTRAQLLTELQTFSATSGRRIDWDDLVTGLANIRKGQPIDYYGLSGPLTLDNEYSVDSSLSIFKLWVIEKNEMVFSSNVACSQPSGR